MESKFVLPKIGELSASVSVDSICRYEKVPTSIHPTELEGAKYAASLVVKAINEHKGESNFVLGLSTGRSPVGLYKELVKMYKNGEVSFKNVEVYSLDEFYPMSPTSPQSRNYRIHEEFLNFVDIAPENVHFPDTTVPADAINAYCENLERKISGKIDLMIMGVGELGQVGFNEPGTYAKSRSEEHTF